LIETEVLNRFHERARDWGVIVEETFETETSVIAFGGRDNEPVVLKVIRQPGDEWRSGEVLEAFDGHGMAHVYEHVPGAVLLERLRPGNSLAAITLNGRDEEATDILADVIKQIFARASSISPLELPAACPTVRDWEKGFERYIVSGDDQLPMELVEAGHRAYADLRASQRQPQLLHGDLQHYNVLFDASRGWLAIDPKGVIGEIEYEIGAVLRNPYERPDLFLSRSIIDRRLSQFAETLNIDYERTLRWAFAQAVLSAIWEIEDGFTVGPTIPALRLAAVIQPMLAAAS
jgi:streptomycin 6-kinase